jgi:hypothetical protein
MNSTLKGLRPASACAPNEFGLQRACSANGRRCANEFDLEGLGQRHRPAPTEKLPRRRRPTPGAQAPRKADFNRREGRPGGGAPNEFGLQGPSANGRPAPTEKYSPRRRRPTPGAQAPRKADFNRRERPFRPSGRLYAANEFDLEGLSARRSASPTEKYSSRRRRPTPGAPAPQKADFNRREGLRPTVGLRRPKNTLRVGEGRRPARKRLRRPISIGAKAFGQRSACADRKILSASAKADARRVAP